MIPDIGAVLKAQRSSREWSLTQAAEKTGVSKAMLGQIERGESSPTVATLWKIATGFNIPFSLFLSDPAAPATAQVQSSKAAHPWQQNPSMQVTPLFPFDAELGFDMLEIALAAGARSDSSAHDSGVVEHVLVTSGSLLLTVKEELYRLHSGEGLRFQADCPHSYYNDTISPVRFQSLIHYPKSR
ncbi:XRE family transcriptional regulator [Erwinia sp. MMLR14_017]|uniref:helix-turn-helix domain-containing protein n=1 Tax=Erwinia sp. MMLR14_017 TaxID=3093842 RepID=UPI0029901763|nr:XRE family transcriptional regulator [Erwinia sp. MMLR14_017]MDW8847495.1 XRE family transcriptional regulator [Erwinia sp. MMLR14_017]